MKKTKKSSGWTYSSKILIWSLLFFLITFIPLIIPLNIYEQTGYFLGWFVLIYGFIYLTMVLFVYYVELRRFNFLSIPVIITLVFSSFLLSLITLGMTTLSLNYYGNFNQNFPLVVVIIGNFFIALVMTLLFMWVLKLVFLNTTSFFQNSRGRELTLSLTFRCILRFWTVHYFSDYTVLITKRNVYLLRYFFDNEKPKSIKFKKKNIEDVEPNEENKSDRIISNMTSIKQSMEKKLELLVVPGLLFEDELPSVYSKDEDFIVCKIDDLWKKIKSFEYKSSLKIIKHKIILDELKK